MATFMLIGMAAGLLTIAIAVAGSCERNEGKVRLKPGATWCLIMIVLQAAVLLFASYYEHLESSIQQDDVMADLHDVKTGIVKNTEAGDKARTELAKMRALIEKLVVQSPGSAADTARPISESLKQEMLKFVNTKQHDVRRYRFPSNTKVVVPSNQVKNVVIEVQFDGDPNKYWLVCGDGCEWAFSETDGDEEVWKVVSEESVSGTDGIGAVHNGQYVELRFNGDLEAHNYFSAQANPVETVTVRSPVDKPQ